MREAVRGIVVGLVALAILGAIASRLGLASFAVPRAGGIGPWLFARVTGLTAWFALSLDVIVGLATSTRVGDRWLGRGQAIDLHGWLSPVMLALVLGHAVVLLADGFVRFDALDLVLPGAASYRPVAVGLGVLAGYAALVVHGSFAFRKRLGTRAWRRLHALSFVAFGAATAHGLLAGTDASRWWVLVLYAVPSTLVLVLLVVRIVRAIGRRPRPRDARAAGVAGAV